MLATVWALAVMQHPILSVRFGTVVGDIVDSTQTVIGHLVIPERGEIHVVGPDGRVDWGDHLDRNGDGFINANDYDCFMEAFNAGSTMADYDRNEFVNGDDFDLFVEDFLRG